MSRAKWKGPYVNNFLVCTINDKNTKEVYTMSRSSSIVPGLLGKTVLVHNGKNFLKVEITKNMLGRKLGEFSPTKKKFSFKKK